MAAPVYYQLAFPHDVGGPGPWQKVELGVTAITTATTDVVKTCADLQAFYAASSDDKARHQRFSDLVTQFGRYGMAISARATSSDEVIQLYFERVGLFSNSTLGKPGWFSYGHRPNGYDLAAEFVSSNNVTVSALTVTIDGTAQNAT